MESHTTIFPKELLKQALLYEGPTLGTNHLLIEKRGCLSSCSAPLCWVRVYARVRTGAPFLAKSKYRRKRACFAVQEKKKNTDPEQHSKASPQTASKSEQKKLRRNGILHRKMCAIKTDTLPKTNMEPKNGGLNDDFPFQICDFQVPSVSFLEQYTNSILIPTISTCCPRDCK